MVQYQAEEKTRQRREWLQKAIQYAMNNQWEDAIAANRGILSLNPDDAEAYNRLGKAYMSLKRYREAYDAYREAARLMPHNTIAEKNLHRLSQLIQEQGGEPAGPAEGQAVVAEAPKVDSKHFIEETGKTGITTLTRTGDRRVLAKMTAGDGVNLVIDGQHLIVTNKDGEHLGQVEPRLARRLIGLMNGGNRYSAAITSAGDHSVRIIIRETYQHPSQLGRLSFPKQAPGLENIRPYIKGTVLRYDFEEEEEEGSEEELEEETEEEEVDVLEEESDFEGDLAEE